MQKLWNKKIPAFLQMLGQKIISAVPPGLMLITSTHAYYHMPNFVYEDSRSVSHTRLKPFRSPSEVHSLLFLISQSHHLRLSGTKFIEATHSSSSVYRCYITLIRQSQHLFKKQLMISKMLFYYSAMPLQQSP